MSDDQREREPLRDQADNPPEHGTRSDLGGTSEGSTPIAPGDVAVERAGAVAERDGNAGGAPADPLSDVDHPTADE
jgi:hypothetical protein